MSTDNKVTIRASVVYEALIPSNSPRMAAEDAVRQASESFGSFFDGVVRVEWEADGNLASGVAEYAISAGRIL